MRWEEEGRPSNNHIMLVSSYRLWCLSAGSRFWARLRSPRKGLTCGGLWFDLVESCEGLVRRIKNLYSDSDTVDVYIIYKMNLQYIVQIRRAHGQPADARKKGHQGSVFEPLDISGSKAGAEPDRVNDDSNCAALLAAAVNDSTDVGCPVLGSFTKGRAM